MRPQPKILREARISTNAISYHLLAWGIPIVTIPLLPIVWLYYRRYFATLEVVLTARELQVSRGVLVREEKSIPLEKITDLALYQGPIMRWLGLKGLRVETAGQSGSGSALVQLIGLDNPDDFRDAALDQRDKVTERLAEAAPVEGKADADPVTAEMLATLLRIEALLRRSDPAGAAARE
jgi:putative membrane protein